MDVKTQYAEELVHSVEVLSRTVVQLHIQFN